MTKITPKPPDTLTLPYKPEESSMKKTKKVARKGLTSKNNDSNNDDKNY